jgi:hypothetical protein
MTNKTRLHGTAEMVSEGGSARAWQPVLGPELDSLLDREFQGDATAREAVKSAALTILAKSVDPRGQGPEQRTGLIVGYVQSGKTLSFTSVAAAGHDNAVRIIVVVAGSTNILAAQSRDRLLRDLNIKGGPLRPWRHFHNPDRGLTGTISKLLEAWDAQYGRNQTVLITALKHQKRIGDVADLLNSLPADKVGTALVIDDEADQASLNSRVRQGERSAVHQSLLRLRSFLERHTYLQYTATPQAPIFIPLIDLLSPDFCEVLEPGEGYVGGHVIFRERSDDVVRPIPAEDLEEDPHVPPESLLKAFRVFLIGVADALAKLAHTGELYPQNRSMLVHPSRFVGEHTIYQTWLLTTASAWLDLLDRPEEPDRHELLRLFEASYADLARTGKLAPLDDIMNWLPEAIRGTEVRAVNSLSEVNSWQDEWNQHYAWVLVGGQKLDRGFTVEGLTVTYMPRGRGVGYADTIQQRGRFFGYKSKYLGLCRVYLEPDVRHAFEVYVDSEESMRAFLKANAAPGALKRPDLKRRFQLDRSLKPTRESVLLDPPRHVDFRTGWFTQSYPHLDPGRSSENERRILAFLEQGSVATARSTNASEWLRDPARARETHIHRVADQIPLEDLFHEVLTGMVMVHAEDLQGWQEALALIEASLGRFGQDQQAMIVFMRPDVETHRGTTRMQAISALHQGAYPDREGKVYRGDAFVRGRVCTLQVHYPNIHEGTAKGAQEEARWQRVPTLALWLSPDSVRDFIVQDQSGLAS